MTAKSYDFLIVGSGPAGSVAACVLAEGGAKVALLDISRENTHFKIGESLPGIGRRLLRFLRMEHLLLPHLPMHQRISSWGSPRGRLATDSLQDPYGSGWWLDRTSFERDLLREALKRGAEQIQGFVSSCHRSEDQQMLVSLRVPSQRSREQLTARWILDASGRACAIARRMGAEREVSHPLWAQYIALSTRSRLTLSVVESSSQGWWYLAPTAPTQAVLMRMQGLRPPVHVPFWEQLPDTGLVRKHLSTLATITSDPGNCRIADASSAITKPFYGPGWCAVGDAAIAFDPLASQGIFHAMQSGYRAAKALLQNDDHSRESALQDYAAEQWRVWQNYRTQRENIYAAETRWPEEPFWSERQVMAATAHQRVTYPHSSATRS